MIGILFLFLPVLYGSSLNLHELNQLIATIEDVRHEIDEYLWNSEPWNSYDWTHPPESSWNTTKQLTALRITETRDVSSIPDLAADVGFRLVRKLRSLENVYIAVEDTAVQRKRRKRDIQGKIEVIECLVYRTRSKRRNLPTQHHIAFVDPLWPHQKDHLMGLLNIPAAWESGVSGAGVTVAIVDDGVDYTHPELSSVYSHALSFDYSSYKSDAMPADGESETHGTRCAGVIAMAANSSFCGVGVAPHARIAGIRILSDNVSDATEAEGLAHRVDAIHVYTSSWGPPDDGASLDGPGPLALLSLEKGIREGRNGLGSVYVWAAGNGGSHDDCAMDGYASHPSVIAVGAASPSSVPFYSEACASLLTSVYTADDRGASTVVTTSRAPSCVADFAGSSAAAPVVAGIVALALEANPRLSYRDVQHLIVLCSDSDKVKHLDSWIVNGAGHRVSRRLGFGVLDAGAMVQASRTWISVDPFEKTHHTFDCSSGNFFHSSPFTTTIQINATSAKYLERVTVRLSLSHPNRGDIAVYLTSPMGTRVQILSPRPLDHAPSGLSDWPLSAVQFWGEASHGEWTLEVANESGSADSGRVTTASLILQATHRRHVLHTVL